MYFESTVEPRRRRVRCMLFGHTWYACGGSLGNTSTVTTYSECTCGARRVVQQGTVHQPVDFQWLAWNTRKVEA